MKTIIAHPNFKYLGKELAKKKGYKFANVDFGKFPDLWPAYFINDVEEYIEDMDIIYIGDFSKPENLFENYSIIRGILEYGAKKLDIFMPFFPVAQMERVSEVGEIAIAKYYADIFSLIPSGLSSKTTLHIFDIHALSVKFYFDSFKVNVDLHNSMSLVKEIIKKNTVIAFPDEGAHKRYSQDFKGYETIICHKVRKREVREIVIKEGNPKGKDVIIIDDLIQSGGTIIKTAELLKQSGAKTVSAFATHGIFPREEQSKVADSLDTLYVSDSIPKNRERAKEIKNMKILELKEMIEMLI